MVFGGNDADGTALGDMWEFTPMADQWQEHTLSNLLNVHSPAGQERTDVPAPRGGASLAQVSGVSGYGCCGGGESLLLFGGWSAAALYLADAWVFSRSNDWGTTGSQWTKLPEVSPSPSGRKDFAMASLGSTTYVFGGQSADSLLADFWKHDFTDADKKLDGTSTLHEWEELAPPSGVAGRIGAAMFEHGGYIYLLGGESDQGAMLADFHKCVRVRAKRVRSRNGAAASAPLRPPRCVRAPWQAPRRPGTGFSSPFGELRGKRKEDPAPAFRAPLACAATKCLTPPSRYEPVGGSWLPLTPIPTPIAFANMAFVDLEFRGDSVFVMGGNGVSGVNDKIFVYDITADSWSESSQTVDAPGTNSTCEALFEVEEERDFAKYTTKAAGGVTSTGVLVQFGGLTDDQTVSPDATVFVTGDKLCSIVADVTTMFGSSDGIAAAVLTESGEEGGGHSLLGFNEGVCGKGGTYEKVSTSDAQNNRTVIQHD
jgi:hypothetical protein